MPDGRPPVTEALLRAALGDGLVARSIVGDLAEEYRRRRARDGGRSARWWYRRAAFGLAVRGVLARMRDEDGWTGRMASAAREGGGRGDGMGTRWMSELSYAARALMRAPGFTVVAVLTLGLAIGANAAVFSVVDGVLLSPLPYANAERLVAINSTTPGNNTPPTFGVSPEFQLQYRGNAPLLEDVALYSLFGGTLRSAEGAERIRGADVTPSFFPTLGVEPALGRFPGPEDVVPGEDGSSAPVVVLSHATWRDRFGGDPGVIGRTLDLDGAQAVVVGVAPPELAFPDPELALWRAFEVTADNLQIGQFRFRMVGLAKEGATPAQVAAQLAPLAARLPELYPDSPRYVAFLVEGRYSPVVTPLKEDLVGDLERPLWIMLGTVGFVLLIACANVANLFLVRAESRQRDMAVRAALGAARRALVGAHLAEAVVIAVLGGALGVGLAWIGVPLLVRAAPDGIPRLDLVTLDGGALAFTAALSLVSALLFGLGAALRYSSPRLLAQLRSAGRGAVGGRERQLGRSGLVAAQSGLALVLLVGSGLLVRSFAELMSTDAGYDTEGLLTFQTTLDPERYSGATGMAAFHMQLVERLTAIPGVESAGAIQNLPLDGSFTGTAIAFEESVSGEDVAPITYFTYVSPRLFETMGIAALRGRTFVNADHESDLGNVVLSRTAAERHWPGMDPLGRRLRLAGDTVNSYTVVGVVEDIRDRELSGQAQSIVYFPLVGLDGDEGFRVQSAAYVVRTSTPEALVPAVRDAVRALDPSLPIYAVQTMEDVVAEDVVRLSFTMLALGVSATMALVLGAVGLYGVLSYLVTRRRQEIGVRLALGAEAEQVRRMVVGQGAKLVGIGMVAGLLAAAGLTRLLEGMLYGTEPLDPVTFGGMAAVMLLVGLLASYVPARRASSVNPLESMRAE